ncbi:hypothetical protein [Microscilla marina]|uniref:Uncharacterized protein n=1 Tax=Microscilla marina ATCC 23134 TaxID=313606 RepID=A1ZQC9_MICM2|nr:hypothetical protein [Microscilla marina]EAY27538.1 hypothetical protein M23134_06939 [Microscilla marina ATCC 23134]
MGEFFCAQKYGHKLDLGQVARQYAQALDTTAKDASMNDYLEMLEGVYERALDPAIKQGEKGAPKVDRENQHVVHDKGLEKEKGRLEGIAEETRSIPANVVSTKPDSGRYVIDRVDNVNYVVGSILRLKFVGTYQGKRAIFKDVVVTVVAPPRTVKGVKYVQVTYAYDQHIQLEGRARKVYFKKDDSKSFYVKIN